MPVVGTLNNIFNEMAKMINQTSRNFFPSFDIKEDKIAYHLGGGLPCIGPKDISMELSHAMP